MAGRRAAGRCGKDGHAADTIAQGLTGIVTQLEAVQQTSNDAERERRIDNAKRLARDSLAEESRANGHLVGESPAAGGFGLIAMRQRVSGLAGQLGIESEPGAATAVSASLPAIPLGESK